MKISSRGCYGLRAMLELARNFGAGPLLMRAISEKHGISRKYLHALLTLLRTAGLVRSIRGSGGGYVLARMPSSITVGEILRVLEGTLSPSECVEDSSLCRHAPGCAALDLWTELKLVLERILARKTLADLASRQAEKEAAPLMYYI